MHRRIPAVSLAATLVLAAACGGESALEPSSTAPPPGAETTGPSAAVPETEITFEWDVDASLDPGGGVEAVGSGGAVSRFTAGRIVLAYDDPAVLAYVVDRYRGTVVRQFACSDYGVPGPAVAVIAVDPEAGDVGTLAASMSALGSDGEVAFGSEEAAAVAAIAAAERAAGRRVGLDWRLEPTEIPWSTQEVDQRTLGFEPDAYQLSYYRRDAVQGIGVAEAWSLMYYAGALDNRVPLAIIDMGFVVDEDLADPVTYAMDPAAIAFGDPVDGMYHGYLTSTIAMGLPDNGYGIAGVAGVVAEPILIQQGDGGLSEYAEAILQAQAMGARIVSMSFIAPVLWDMGPLADALDEVTAAVADSGVLMFSSAGNGGGHLDDILAERPALLGTRPCQSPGVVCVGGLDWDSNWRHEDSVHSDPGGSVDLYAPYCVYALPPEGTGSITLVCGTSMSAPFAAGVAALVWASDPSLEAAEVWDLMQSTLRGDYWPRVNALDAVAAALGPFTNVVFVEPAPESEHDLGGAVTLAAMVAIPTDMDVDSREVRVTFASDRDGQIDDHTWSVPMQHDSPVTLQRVSATATGLTEGTHVFTVTAEAGGAVSTDTRTISVGNTPPSDLVIRRPDDGSEFCAGEMIRFRGDAFDVNQQLGLPESAFVWRSDRDGRIGIGRNVDGTLSAGNHRVRMRVTDAGGLRTDAFVEVTVLSSSDPACVDLPPDVEIVEPASGTDFMIGDPDVEWGRDEIGDYVVFTVRVEVTDDRDPPGPSLAPIVVAVPGEEYSVQGSGYEVEVTLHLPDGECSVVRTIGARSTDSGGNSGQDEIIVTVTRFC